MLDNFVYRKFILKLTTIIWQSKGLVKKYRGSGPEHLKRSGYKTHDSPLPYGTKLTDPPLNGG